MYPKNWNDLVRVLPGTLIVLLVGTLLGCNGGEVSAQKYFQLGVAAEQKGDLATAVVQLKNALQQDPRYVDARWELCQVYIKMGKGAAAQKELERAQALGRTGTQASMSLVRVLLMQEKYKDALTEAQKLADSDDKAGALVLKGQALTGLGRKDDAVKAFNQALESEPQNLDAKCGLGEIALAQGRLEDVQKLTDAILAADQSNLHGLLLLGKLELRRSQPKQALKAFSRAVDVAPYDAAGHLGLASTLLVLNKPAEAEKQANKAGKIAPSSSMAAYLFALSQYEQGRLSQAQEVLLRLLKVYPYHAQSLVLAGIIHLAKGELEQAQATLTRGIALRPDYVPARKLLAIVRLRLNHPEGAIALLRPVADEGSKDAQLLALLGSAYLRAGEFQNATQYLQMAASRVPSASDLPLYLAQAHVSAGEPDKAVEVLQHTISRNPELLQADTLLVLVYLKEGNSAAALKAARGLAEKQPKNPIGEYLMGQAYEAAHQPDEAKARYERALTLQATYAPAALGLAKLDLDAGKQKEARERLESLLRQPEMSTAGFKAASLRLAALQREGGDLASAEKTYNALLERVPDNPEALMQLSEMAASRGKLQEMVHLLEQARTANPRAVEPRTALARYHLLQGNASLALPEAKEAAAIAPDDSGVLYTLAEAQRAAGLFPDAISTYQRVIELSPATVEPYLGLAAAAAQAGDRDRASAATHRALEAARDKLSAELKNGSNAKLMWSLGRIELLLGANDAARSLARRLETEHPDSPLGYALKGDVLAATNAPTQALAAYESALAKGAGAEVLLKQYRLHQQMGQKEAGVKRLLDWLASHPTDVAIRSVLATAYLRSGDKGKALQEYEKAYSQGGRNPTMLNNLAWLYVERRDPRALAVAQEANRLAPADPEIQDTYGWALVSAGKAEQGLVLLRQASAAMPEDPTKRYHLAYALVKGGNPRAARAELAKALGSQRSFAERGLAERLLQALQ